MTEQKLIEKIQNLLDLANNNPNEHEAIAAALKAQELMAKYNVSMEQFQDRSEELTEVKYSGTKGSQTLKPYLASIVARNFCCEMYLITKRGQKSEVVFYGYKKDVTVALQVFTYLFETATKLGNKYWREAKKAGTADKNTWNNFMIGFADGVDEVLAKQCTALMLVTPKEVKDAFAEKTRGCGSKTTKVYTSDYAAMMSGQTAGRETASAREIACA